VSLRTLAARLVQRDWTAVVIEVLIVVVGILVALQVSNWNENRKDAERGDAYLQRLHDELLQDADTLEAIAAFWAQVAENGEAALAYAERRELQDGSAWKTLRGYYQASQVWPYRKPDVTFQEIRSSGSLLLIRDDELRARIARHYSAASDSQVVEVLGLLPRYREHVRGLVPWTIQRYIWTQCYESQGALQVLKECDSPASEAEALAVLEQLRATPDLTAELRFWMVNVNNGLALLQGIRADAQVLAQDVLAARTATGS
jgi:hypothetical protein